MIENQGIVTNQAAQGDILVTMIPIEELPELEKNEIFSLDGPAIEGYITLALGEATGHRHKIDVRKNQAKMRKAKNMDRFFVLVENNTDWTHDEHNQDEFGDRPNPMKLGSSKKYAYEVVRQREATTDGRERVVAD